MTAKLSIEQKQELYREGYLILKGAVSRELTSAARTAIEEAERNPEPVRADDPNFRNTQSLGQNRKILDLRDAALMTDLVNKSTLTPVMTECMGPFDPVTHARMAIAPIQREPGKGYNALGYLEKDQPYFGAQMHLDGLCGFPIVEEPLQGTVDEIYQYRISSLPCGNLGRTAELTGTNYDPLFMDPEMTLGIGSFTAFIFVCLNDQSREGCGQTAILPRGHHVAERFFNSQRAAGERLGQEGPGWPRFDYSSPNRCGMKLMPDYMYDALTDEASECTPDGKRWPKPTQLLMEEGDAAIVTNHTPHSGSRNERGSQSRKTAIFRLRAKSHQPSMVVDFHGHSDHPDRGYHGEWMEYPEGVDPWERSKHLLCHPWEVWEGMQQVVAAERAKVNT